MAHVGRIQLPALCRMLKILIVNKHANDSKHIRGPKCAPSAEPPNGDLGLLLRLTSAPEETLCPTNAELRTLCRYHVQPPASGCCSLSEKRQ